MSDVRNGIRAGVNIVPTFAVMFLGYGLTAGVRQIPEWSALLSTLLVFSVPAQFAMVEAAAQGGGIVQLASIAVIVNLRFFVMSLALTSAFDNERRLGHLLWCQFVTATTYLTTFFHWRGGRAANAFAFYQGVVLSALPAALVGTAVGLWFGSGLPALVAFGATLILPVYFSLMIAGEKLTRSEYKAVILGFILTPPVEVLLPGWGLFVVALAVGIFVYRRTSGDSREGLQGE